MADAWLCSGINPDAPEDVHLVVAVDPAGPVGERAVAGVAVWGAEVDGAVYILQTDAWVERALRGDRLTVDVMAYPRLLSYADAEAADFPERPLTDPDAVRLLRVVTTVDPVAYGQAGEETVVLDVPAGSSAAEVVAAIQSGEDWPTIYAPAPTGVDE
ncbi:hypothetical protein [Streptacidiphilus albus]|uniref:hypothetical protein n=1 Tax=Streptacidiphilus albus TaxID=105425 RepID=UPI00054BF53E|nr:hypothetical protein [Streptacidiphilus albus]